MIYECNECDGIDHAGKCRIEVPGISPVRCPVSDMIADWKIADCTEQQVQPDNAEKDVPFGYYPNNEFEE